MIPLHLLLAQSALTHGTDVSLRLLFHPRYNREVECLSLKTWVPIPGEVIHVDAGFHMMGLPDGDEG